MRFKDRVQAYLELLRIHNVIATLLTTMMGWLTVRVVAPTLNIASLIIPLFAVAVISSAGYVINDYFDAEVDKVNKPYRPIPSGRVTAREALALSLALFLTGTLPSTFVGLYTTLFVWFNACVVFLYSYRIKEWGLLGNVVVSLEGAFTIILGALTPSELLGNLSLVRASLVPALYAFTLLLAREVVKTVEDLRADEVRKVRSLPRVIGVRKAALVAAALQAFIVGISPIPYLTGYGYIYLVLALVTDVLILSSIVRTVQLGKSENPELIAAKLRSVLKVAIFTGTMAFTFDLLVKILTTESLAL
ncbi:MAG: geranylgeranylglycerol-phosphate geranylgeranyltransferase [Zestosphaera sp.]